MNTKAVYAACLFAALNICTLSARADKVQMFRAANRQAAYTALVFMVISSRLQ